MSTKYDLSDIDQKLVSGWTRSEDRLSLRELAEYFNLRVLRAAMEASGLVPLDGEVENLYRLLTADDVSKGMRTQAKMRLEREGVNVDQLEGDFVSYQTVNRHLKDCLDVEQSPPERDDKEDIRNAAQRIYALQNRTATVTEKTLEQLHRQGEVSIDTFDVLVDISVICTECGTHLDLANVIEGETCLCD